MEYNIGSIVTLKKNHPCKTLSKQFIILAIDGEVRLKCLGCNGIVLLKRSAFEKSLKNIEK